VVDLDVSSLDSATAWVIAAAQTGRVLITPDVSSSDPLIASSAVSALAVAVLMAMRRGSLYDALLESRTAHVTLSLTPAHARLLLAWAETWHHLAPLVNIQAN